MKTATTLRGALGLVLALTLAPGVAAAVELPSHLGVLPDAFVTLEYQNVTAFFSPCPHPGMICNSPRRVLPDGTRDNFSIPRDHVLIITDVTWRADGSEEGDVLHIRVSDASYIAEAQFNSRKDASYNEHFTSGLVFSKAPVFIVAGHADAKLFHLFVRGYLVPRNPEKPLPFPGERMK